jgi:hypothetical protein
LPLDATQSPRRGRFGIAELNDLHPASGHWSIAMLAGRLLHGDQLLDRFRQRLINRRGVALVGVLHGHRHDRAGVEIDRVLRLMRQVRAANRPGCRGVSYT